MAKNTPKVGNSNIGTDGNPGSGAGNSSEGAQFPFLPSADSFKSGSLGSAPKKSGKSGTTTTRKTYEGLPETYPSGFNKGKK